MDEDALPLSKVFEPSDKLTDNVPPSTQWPAHRVGAMPRVKKCSQKSPTSLTHFPMSQASICILSANDYADYVLAVAAATSAQSAPLHMKPTYET